MRFFQGEGYADFKEKGMRRVSPDLGKHFVATQTQLITHNLEKELKLASTRSRRQAMSYLLEQCVLLCEAAPLSNRPHERRKLRWVSRLVERARRAVRREK